MAMVLLTSKACVLYFYIFHQKYLKNNEKSLFALVIFICFYFTFPPLFPLSAMAEFAEEADLSKYQNL